MDATTALLIVAGAAAAGFVQGLSGFAFGLVATAFWAWTIEPQLVGPMVVFGSLVGQVVSIRAIAKSFSLARTLPFVIGGVAGIPIGVVILKNLDPTAFKLFVGATLALYCGVSLLSSRFPKVTFGGRLADGGAGFVGGVMGGIGGLSGPAPTLWSALRGWKKDAQRAVFQSFNLAMHGMTLVVYATTGLITKEAGWIFLLIAPVIFIPSLAGIRLYKRTSEGGFRKLVLILLALSGVAMVLSAGLELARTG